MQRCPACDHFNLVDEVTCERCGGTLSAESLDAGVAEPAVDPAADSFEGRVLHAARTNGKIAAIKLYREQRGGGLKEAKEAVEAIMAEYGVTVGTSGSGCGTSVLAILIALITIARLLAA